MRLYFIFILFFLTHAEKILAQDTLFLFNGTKKNAVIKEISPTQVKFIDANKVDGPLYILNHTAISHIIYADGQRDTLKILYPKAYEIKVEAPVIIYKPEVYFIQKARIDFNYQGRRLSEKNMIIMTEAFNTTKKDAGLKSLINQTKRHKKIQHLTGFGSIGIAIITYVAGAIALTSGSFNNPDFTLITSGVIAIAGVSLFITAQTVSRINKKRRTKSARLTAERYNQLLETP